MSFIDKIKDLAGKHDKQVDAGLDKAAEAAKHRIAGHDQHIDAVVDKAKAARRTAGPGE